MTSVNSNSPTIPFRPPQQKPPVDSEDESSDSSLSASDAETSNDSVSDSDGESIPIDNRWPAQGPHGYEDLEFGNAALFACDFIEEMSAEEAAADYGHVPTVNTDDTAMIIVDQHVSALGTYGMGPCVAICATAKTRLGQDVLWLTHASGCNFGTPGGQRSAEAQAEGYYETLLRDLNRVDCVPNSIRIYVVGGNAHDYSRRGEVRISSSLYHALVEPQGMDVPLAGVKLPLVRCGEDAPATDLILTKYGIKFYRGEAKLRLGPPRQTLTEWDPDEEVRDSKRSHQQAFSGESQSDTD